MSNITLATASEPFDCNGCGSLIATGNAEARFHYLKGAPHIFDSYCCVACLRKSWREEAQDRADWDRERRAECGYPE